MESFRKLIKGWLGIALLVVFLTPLALVGIEGYFGGSKQKDDVAATVNKQDISNKDLEQLTKAYQQQYLQYVKGDESLLNMTALKNSAMNTLVAQALLLQQAQKLGISLSNEQFIQMLQQVPDFQKDGTFSNEIFGNYLRSKGLTKEILINNLRQDRALKMLSGSISNYALLGNNDLSALANLELEERQLYLSSIKLDEYKKNITVSAKEISDYYNQHKENFKNGISVDVDYVVVNPEMFAKELPSVTQSELEQEYTHYVENQKKSAAKIVKHILITRDNRSDTEALKLANEIENKLKTGTPFNILAKQYSEDPTSKDKGGNLENYQTGTLGSQTFDDAVSKLSNGQVSEPVKTNFGYHIIQVEIIAPKIATFDAMKNQLTTDIEKRKTLNLYTDHINALNENIISNDSLDVLSQQVKQSQLKQVKNVTIWNKDIYLSNSNVKAKLFNDDVKNGDRNVSSSIQLPNNEVIWVKVRQYHPQGIQTLAEATLKIREDLISEKAAKLAIDKIQPTLKAFETIPASQALTQSVIKFEKAGMYTRQNLKKEVANTAFALNTPKEGMWSIGTTKLADEVVVVGVATVKNVDIKSITPEQLQQIKQLYQQTRNEQEMSDYIDYLKSIAKIK